MALSDTPYEGALTEAQEQTISDYKLEMIRLGADDPRAVVLVQSRNDAHSVTERLGQVKAAVAQLEEIRKAVTAPLRERVDAINGLIAAVRDPLKAWGEKARMAIAHFMEQEERERKRKEDEARRAAEELARKEGEALAKAEAASNEYLRTKHMAKAAEVSRELTRVEQQAQAVAKPVKGFKTQDGTSVSARERWTFEVVDAAKVPREYLMVDEKKIRALVNAGVRSIEGVNIYPERGVTVR